MIKEIDESKYIVYKTEDLNKLSLTTFNKFLEVNDEYYDIRIKQNKKSQPKYLVLKMDDEISINELIVLISDRCKKLGREDFYNVSIKVIATDIINSILKLKKL